MTKSIKRHLTLKRLAERYGVCDMTIYRWRLDPDLKFPKPIWIGRRPFFDEALIEIWEDSRAGNCQGEVA